MKKTFLIGGILALGVAALFFLAPIGQQITGAAISSADSVCIRKCISTDVFSALPPFPTNFTKNFNAYIGEDVYKQPEYYPTFAKQGVPYYINPPGGYLGIYGYGSYPSQDAITITENSFEKPFFAFNSWYVFTYQGLNLRPEYDSSLFNVSIEPNNLLLEPTYPRFEYNWTQRVYMRVQVKDGTPPGRYKIYVNANPPSDELSERWAGEHPKRYSSSGMFGTGEPFYTLIVVYAPNGYQ